MVVSVTSPRVVEQLDVIEDIRPAFIVRGVDPTLDALPLEQLEEALGDGVVVAIAATAHAADDAVSREEGLPLMAGELAALIGMKDQAWRRLALRA